MNSKTILFLIVTLIFGLFVDLIISQLNFSTSEVTGVGIHDNVGLLGPKFFNNSSSTFSPKKHNHLKKAVFVSYFSTRHTDNIQSFLSAQSYSIYQSAPEKTHGIQSANISFPDFYFHTPNNKRTKSDEGFFNSYTATSFGGLNRFTGMLPERNSDTKSKEGVRSAVNSMSTPFSNNTMFRAPADGSPPNQGDNPEGEPLPLGSDLLVLSCFAIIYLLVKFIKHQK